MKREFKKKSKVDLLTIYTYEYTKNANIYYIAKHWVILINQLHTYSVNLNSVYQVKSEKNIFNHYFGFTSILR